MLAIAQTNTIIQVLVPHVVLSTTDVAWHYEQSHWILVQSLGYSSRTVTAMMAMRRSHSDTAPSLLVALSVRMIPGAPLLPLLSPTISEDSGSGDEESVHALLTRAVSEKCRSKDDSLAPPRSEIGECKSAPISPTRSVVFPKPYPGCADSIG